MINFYVTYNASNGERVKLGPMPKDDAYFYMLYLRDIGTNIKIEWDEVI